MRLALLLLLLALAACNPPQQPETPASPPLEAAPPPAPAPGPAPLPPLAPQQWGYATFSAAQSPRWFQKLHQVAYRLEWRFPDGTWRPALTYLPELGVGYVGYMTEAAPAVRVRLPVGSYRVTYGPSQLEPGYIYHSPALEHFEVELEGGQEPLLHSTAIWR